MERREFLLLAHKYTGKQYIGGWFLSEKLDGMRCFWDGGITTGIPKHEVPWANTDKDDRYVEEQICTGFWSRYGNVIHAPKHIIYQMPPFPLDGELYSSVLSRQQIMSIVKQLTPDYRWDYITYYVIDSPPLKVFASPGRINTPNFRKIITKDVWTWIKCKCVDRIVVTRDERSRFEDTQFWLTKSLERRDFVQILDQKELPRVQEDILKVVEERLEQVLEDGGEGVMLRDRNSWWSVTRSHKLLKYKPYDDAEATVIGYVSGRETDRGSKLLGLMGAMKVRMDNGIEFELSGFTDVERELIALKDADRPEFLIESARQWAEQNPGCEVPNWIQASHFPRGERVTFKYRGMTDDGVPQEARYWRHHD